MKYIIQNVSIPLGEITLENELDILKKRIAKKIKVDVSNINNLKILKESIDARRKTNISVVYSAEFFYNDKIVIYNNNAKIVGEKKETLVVLGNSKLENRPIIVGSGPAGLFAGLELAVHGFRPIIVERGQNVEERTKIVNKYWRDGLLDTETNVQFGEGGAGTFSDGKLTTRINDERCEKVLETFFQCGANEEILYKSKPHIGSDVLKKVVVNIRKRIEELGGEIRFSSKLTELNINEGRIKSIVINGSEEILADVVILAIGHSARDTFEMLYNKGVQFLQKPFSVGVRIEHPQELINKSQYGDFAGHAKLGAAEYQLFHKLDNRTVYSFCMCPGGLVVAAASEMETIVTNGMSQFARDGENANSALVVSVFPGDFNNTNPLSGIEFQREIEKRAFKIAGSDGSAPIQTLEAFLLNKKAERLGTVRPSYTGKVTLANLNECLPGFVSDNIKKSLTYLDNKLKGFGLKDALLTGVETRTSSPVRIPRNEDFESISAKGLYPTGEGAGYAGGIMSAAVDGIRIAEKIIEKYRM